MTWLLITMFLWAVTAMVAYWFFFTPVSTWLDKFLERHAAVIGPFFFDPPAEAATARTKRALYIVEVILFGVGLLVSRHPLFGAWAAGMGLFGIRYYGHYLRRRAADRFDDQLVDVAMAFRNSLKAGLSIPQTMQMIASDFAPPAADQFRMAVREIQVGASIEESLRHLVERVPNADLRMMVGSIEVLRQTGGNMVETFEGVAETIKNRKKVEGKIKSLTAQGKFQTILLCAMPFVMLLILYVMNREYVTPLFTSFLGWLILSVVVLLVVTGYVIIDKITSIEV